MSNFVVNIVSTDDLAQLGARPMAGTVITKRVSCICCILRVKTGSRIRKNIYRSNVQVTFELYNHFRCYRSCIPNKIIFTKVLSYSVDFKAPREFWNPLSKAVPNKFHRFGRHSECNCLQDQANFNRSRAWQIVLIFNTVIRYNHVNPQPTQCDKFKCKFHTISACLSSHPPSCRLDLLLVTRGAIENWNRFEKFLIHECSKDKDFFHIKRIIQSLYICWCSGPWHHQDISRRDIDCINLSC